MSTDLHAVDLTNYGDAGRCHSTAPRPGTVKDGLTAGGGHRSFGRSSKLDG